MREGDAAHPFEDGGRLDQTALVATRQVDLRDVAGDHRAAAEADAREKHFHLLGRGVLRFVENDERVIQRAAAHEGQWRHFDHAALKEFGDFFETHQVVERVIQRTQIGIDFLRHVAGQKSQAFTSLDRRTHQHQTLDAVAFERIDRAGDGQIGLAGAGRADRKGDVVFLDLLEVFNLARRASVQILAACFERRYCVFNARRRVATGNFDQSQLQVVDRQIVVRAAVKTTQCLRRQARLFGFTAQ